MTGRRMAIAGDGIPEHPQPFPPAVRLGNLVFSSAIGGQDPDDGSLPADAEAQMRNAFRHVVAIMRQAGGSIGDVAKVTVYLTDRAHRSLLNPVWIEHFPDADDRPVRHSVVAPLPGGMLVQLEITAVIADG